MRQPETGRTHQIRVHLSAIGHPIVGDKVHGGRAERKSEVRGSSGAADAARLEVRPLPPEDQRMDGVRGSATGRLHELVSFGAVSDATEDERFLRPSIRSCPTEGRGLAPPTARGKPRPTQTQLPISRSCAALSCQAVCPLFQPPSPAKNHRVGYHHGYAFVRALRSE